MAYRDLSRIVYEGADTISGRDLYARHRELEQEREEITNRLTSAEEERDLRSDPDSATSRQTGEAWEQELADLEDKRRQIEEELKDWDNDDDLGGELKRLVAVEQEYSLDDELISDAYFKEYAQQLAEDLGLIKEGGWPVDYIDWDRAADALKADYGSLVYGTTDYWIRS